MDKVTIDLPSDLAERLREAVARGDYVSEGDVVADALEVWDERRFYTPEAVAGLRRAVQAGFSSGVPRPFDMARIRRDAKARAEQA